MTDVTRFGLKANSENGTRIEVRRATQRFETRTDWLLSYHSFSFGPH